MVGKDMPVKCNSKIISDQAVFLPLPKQNIICS